MAVPNNAFDTYETVGIRENLLDNIYNVDPYETPALSSLPKIKASNTYVEWQTQGLNAPSANNAAIEGDDITAEAARVTTRLGNYTQIFRKSVTITGTQEATTKAGRAREMALQKLLMAQEMKTDMESSMFANQARVAGDGSVTPRRLAGVPAWITTSTSAGSGGSDPTGDGTDARTDGTQRAFTEALLKAVLKSIWDNSGKAPDCVYMGSFNKQAASAFAGSSAVAVDRNQDAASKSITTAVDVYVYDFGRVRFEANRHVRARDAIVMRSDMWAWADLRPMFEKPLPDTGDAKKTALLAESTLLCRNELASGIVADLTSA